MSTDPTLDPHHHEHASSSEHGPQVIAPTPGLPWIAGAVQGAPAEPTARHPRFGGEVAIEREQLLVQAGVA